MEPTPFLQSPLYAYVVLPVLLFCARICDVSMGTIRVICVSRGLKFLAALTGFFEVLIWVIVIGQIFQNLNNIACHIGYAAGFAGGNYIGIVIAEKVSQGKVILRIITQNSAVALIQALRAAHYGVTTASGHGATGSVNMVLSIMNRTDLHTALPIVQQYNPHAFYLVEDVRHVREGIFPMGKSPFSIRNLWLQRPSRKGK